MLLIIFDGLGLGASPVRDERRLGDGQGVCAGSGEDGRDAQYSSSCGYASLISGRGLVVQENESEFRRPRRILSPLLPYYLPESSDTISLIVRGEEEYQDPKGLLKNDLRQAWWKNYGRLTGKAFQALSSELGRPDLDEESRRNRFSTTW